MKVGDKILVTYSDGDQFVGRIYGETEKSWRVEFDDGSKKTVRKTTDIQVINDPERISVTAEEMVEAAEAGVGPEETVEEHECCKDPVHYERKDYKPTKKVRRNNVLILLGILLVMAAIGAVVVWQTGVLF